MVISFAFIEKLKLQNDSTILSLLLLVKDNNITGKIMHSNYVERIPAA